MTRLAGQTNKHNKLNPPPPGSAQSSRSRSRQVLINLMKRRVSQSVRQAGPTASRATLDTHGYANVTDPRAWQIRRASPVDSDFERGIARGIEDGSGQEPLSLP